MLWLSYSEDRQQDIKDIIHRSSEMYFVGSVCLILLLYMVTKFLSKILYIKNSLKSFPGPPPVFILGNFLDFLGDKGMIKVLLERNERYGPLVKSRMGPFIYGLEVTDYVFMKQVLLGKSNLSKGQVYDLTKCWLGEGLLTAEEKKWKTQRKMLTPAFSNQMIIEFIEVFDRQAQILTDKFKKLIPVDTINVHKFLSLCSLDIICETSMGVSINAQINDDLEYIGCVRDICNIISRRSMSFWKLFEPLFWFSSDYRKQRKCLNVIRNHVNQVIAMRRKQRANMKNLSEDDEFGSKQKLALLDILLEYSENETHLSQKEIEDEVHTFMFAGHDTTTATMAFVMYELARNSNIQELAVQEQKRIFGNDRDRKIDLYDIQNMKYLDMVIKEALRLYPPVSIIARRVDKEFKFQNSVIPEGIILLLFIYGLHRNPELFPNPDVFDPLRFEDPETVYPFSFIPFSTGPRDCIGKKFAMYEMKVILSKLLRNFKFSSTIPQHNLDLRAEVVLTSRNGVNVKIDQRSW